MTSSGPRSGDEIELISDGDGLAVIGAPGAVEAFLAAEGLPSRDLGLPSLRSVLGTGAGVAQAASEIAATSGRWVKLTEESAARVAALGLRQSTASGLSTGVLKSTKGNAGAVGGFVEFARSTPTSLLTNPAVLTGAAGIMAQVAMQQQMSEITDYLATIDEKVDDILRGQKDSVLARMIGVGLVIDEAMLIRDARGRVDEITWSKVHTTPSTIAETQAYALRRLDALTEKIEAKAAVDDLVDVTARAEAETQEWLAVLARCFQLQDAIAVLELDRVLDASPAELDGHRRGLQAARRKRLEGITVTTERLLERMAAAAGAANRKVLFNPMQSPAVVRSSNRVTVDVVAFRERLGIDSGRESVEARQWASAASDLGRKAAESGSEGLDGARRLGTDAVGRVRSTSGRVSTQLGGFVRNRRGRDDVPGDS